MTGKQWPSWWNMIVLFNRYYGMCQLIIIQEKNAQNAESKIAVATSLFYIQSVTILQKAGVQ